jgi:hypothetical protein
MQLSNTCREVEWCGYRTDARYSAIGSQLPGKLKRYITSQRETDDKTRDIADGFNYLQDIAGLARMVERSAAVGLGPTATAHVEPMRGVSGFQQRLGKAAGISSVT